MSDPLGRPVAVSYLVLPDGTAVVESAAALGLNLVADAERDPLRASSAGLGELLAAVIAWRPARVLVGVGGTATVDGGAGLRSVLPQWPDDPAAARRLRRAQHAARRGARVRAAEGRDA